MDRLTELLSAAEGRATAAKAPYAGACTPKEASELLKLLPNAKLVDIRTRAEWDFVGRIPGAAEIQFLSYPDNAPNGLFVHLIEGIATKDTPLLLICRSGGRSHAAATHLAAAGYTRAFNVLEGFEGDKDASGHRNAVGGWRFAGLPWVQS